MKDLFFLVADKNQQHAIQGALPRFQALGIRPVEFMIRAHPGRDGGLRKSGPETLALERRFFRHGILVLDFEGSGTACRNSLELEAELDERLRMRWGRAAKAIVIEPECDAWVWGSTNAVEEVIGWPEGERLDAWVRRHGFLFGPDDKPLQPKEAMEAALRQIGLPRSSALYERITDRISLKRCQDAAFLRLKAQLQSWLPSTVLSEE